MNVESKKYFAFHGYEFIPSQKKKKLVKKYLGYEKNKNWVVGYGIIPWLKKNGVDIKITEFESVKSWKPLDLSLIKDEWSQRDIQIEMVKSLANKIVGNVVSVMASGKTQAILCLAYLISQQGGNVLILVPSIKTKENMLKSAKDELGLNNVHNYDHIRHSVVNNHVSCNGQIIVSLDKSLLNDASGGDYKFFNTITGLITDEAHNWSRNGWNKLLEHLPSLNRCHGFSATSISKKEENSPDLNTWNYRALAALVACGPVTYRTSINDVKEFIDIPKLINYKFKWDKRDTHGLTEIDKRGNEKSIGDWSLLSGALSTNNYRNRHIIDILYLLESQNRRTLIIINDVDRIKLLLSLLGSETAIGWIGNDIAFNHLGLPIDVNNTIENINKGNYLTVFATSHVEEGWNVPILNAMLLVESKSMISTIQRSGRLIRRSGVEPVLINLYDDFGVYETHSKLRAKELSNYYEEKFVDVNNLQELNQLLQNV